MHWYVMHAKPYKEGFLSDQLRMRNLEVYCPCIKCNPNSPQPAKKKPYFPGYLFVRVNLDEMGDSIFKWAPGSIGIVRFGGDPAWVPDAVIDELRCRVDRVNKVKSQPRKDFHTGDAVEIRSKPFEKYNAIFDEYIPGRDRVRVLLQMVNDRQVCIELSSEEIEPKERTH